MPTVQIPASHFTNNVKSNYNDHSKALIREFLQNSIDAGSNHVDFVLDNNEKSLTISDDGCGMTREILVKALLTMSGSYKENCNSIGGFGAAKEILLFQHERYEIRTCRDGITTCVAGVQLEYEFVNGELDHNGTVIKIWFHEAFNLTDGYRFTISDYLNTCDTRAVVTFNGNVVDKLVAGDLVRELDWCRIYVEVDGGSHHYAHVRINGVTMFSPYVDNTKFKVVIEVTKVSTEILTVNRDGFKYAYADKLSKLIYEISVEKGNFGKVFGKALYWRGNNRTYENIEFDFEAILENTDKKFAEFEDRQIKGFVREMKEVAAKAVKERSGDNREEVIRKIQDEIKSKATDLNIPDLLINCMLNSVNDQVCDHFADFHIEVTGKGFDKIPEHLQPGKWGKRTIKLAQLWKRCIKIVMQSNGMNQPYTIGWVIDNDEKIQALFKRRDGVSVLMLNPMLTWMDSSNHGNVFHMMLMIAAHEIAHMTYIYHNEDFMGCYDNLLHHALCYLNKSGNSWWKEYLACKNERI